MFVKELVGALVQVLLFAVIPFIVWLIAGRKKENFFKWIGLKKPQSEGSAVKPWLIAAAAMAVYFAASLFVVKSSGDVTTAHDELFGGKGVAAVPAILAYSFIRTGLSEEIIFRGFILRLKNKHGFAAANVIQAAAFGALHGVPIFLKTKNVLALVLLTALPGIAGWVLGWLDEKHDGSIIPGWFMHGALNVISALIYI